MIEKMKTGCRRILNIQKKSINKNSIHDFCIEHTYIIQVNIIHVICANLSTVMHPFSYMNNIT